MFLSQRIYIFFTFHTYFQISPQKRHNSSRSHHLWIEMLISPSAGYQWRAKDVCHSVCLARTTKGTIAPTIVEWLTVPACLKTEEGPGTWGFQFQNLESPRETEMSGPPEVTTTLNSCVAGNLWEQRESVATVDWTRNEHLGEGRLITWHEEMIWTKKTYSLGTLLWEQGKNASVD